MMVPSQDSLLQRAHKLEGMCLSLSWEPTLLIAAQAVPGTGVWLETWLVALGSELPVLLSQI